MIEHSKAIKFLNTYEPILTKGFHWIKLLRSMVNDEQAKIVEAQWLNYKRTDVKSALYQEPDLMTESSYDDCINMELSADNHCLKVTLLIYDGDMVDGCPTKVRCRFILTVDKITTEFDSLLMKHIHKKAVEDIIRDEEQARQRLIEDKALSILEAL